MSTRQRALGTPALYANRSASVALWLLASEGKAFRVSTIASRQCPLAGSASQCMRCGPSLGVREKLNMGASGDLMERRRSAPCLSPKDLLLRFM